VAPRSAAVAARLRHERGHLGHLPRGEEALAAAGCALSLAEQLLLLLLLLLLGLLLLGLCC
jgi:hypothetical protein